MDVPGIGGGSGIVDMRFALRASVGLTVRAPRPEMRPPTVDCRFEAAVGVFVRHNVGLAGERPIRFDAGWSSVLYEVD